MGFGMYFFPSPKRFEIKVYLLYPGSRSSSIVTLSGSYQLTVAEINNHK